VDPCAAILVFLVTGLLCLGIKEVSFNYNLFIQLLFEISFSSYISRPCELEFFFLISVTYYMNPLYMQSTVVQGIITSVNVCALLFVIVAGGYIGFKSGWVGYELPTGYFNFFYCFAFPRICLVRSLVT
jgi:cationic amino acid transporter 1